MENNMTPREQLLAGIVCEGMPDDEAAVYRDFIDAMTDEQVQQLLDLDGFTEEYKIPIWADDFGGPAHDANKKRDREPDRYLIGTTTPRRIAEDLVLLMQGAADLDEVRERIAAAKKLYEVQPQYWSHLGAIFGGLIPFDENLFSSDFWPLNNGPLINSIKRVTPRNLEYDLNGTASATLPDGTVIRVENYRKLRGALSISTNKLLDTAIAHLTNINYFRGNERSIIKEVHIPLIEYGKKNGYHVIADTTSNTEEQEAENKRVEESIKSLRKSINRDLEVLFSIRISGKDKRGKNVADYKDIRIVQDKGITNGFIDITFGDKAASYLNGAYQTQYHAVLLKIDNRKPNAYFIGYAIGLHSNMDSNIAAGTENTLSVTSLLDNAPDIPTIKTVISQRASWKGRIKKPLEDALDENIAIGHLARWEYRHPRTSKRYTSASADSLTWDEYSRLMVDYVMVDTPDQTERRERRAEERRIASEKAAERREKIAIAAAESGEKKKRGRPRKEKK